VYLPGEDPKIFRDYLALVYSGNTYVKFKAQEFDTQSYEKVYKICQLYVLADRLQDTKSKTLIIDVMLSEAHKDGQLAVSKKTILLVYKNTPETCPLRNLLVNAYAIYSPGIYTDKFPKRFLFDLAATLMMIKQAKVEFEYLGDASDYHCEDSASDEDE
jgi:hypothetical protein